MKEKQQEKCLDTNECKNKYMVRFFNESQGHEERRWTGRGWPIIRIECYRHNFNSKQIF